MWNLCVNSSLSMFNGLYFFVCGNVILPYKSVSYRADAEVSVRGSGRGNSRT